MSYQADEKLVINPAAQMRNEGKYVVALFPDPLSVPVVRLNPLEGVVVTLFDGERTYDEVADIMSVMVREDSENPTEETGKMLDYIVDKFVQPQGGATEPVLVPTDKAGSGNGHKPQAYIPTDFIIKPEAYRPNDLRLNYPVSILWLLTNDCQTNCQYCYMHKPPVPRKELLPFERVREIVQEVHENGMLGIYPSGGDVLCYPHFWEFLDLMEEYKFQPTVIPTKAYVSRETARRLKKYNYVKDLQLSIDSTVPEVADYLTLSPGFCARTLESIRNGIEAGLTVQVKSVITPYNIMTIPKLYRDLKAMGVADITLATYCRSGYHHQDRLFNHPGDYEWLDKQLKILRKEFPEDRIEYQNGPPQMEPQPPEEIEKVWKNRNTCTAGRTCLTITAAGKVVSCEQMPEREGDYLGDVRNHSIAEVWNGRQLDEYLIHPPREKFKGTPCYDCDEYEECQTVYGQCVRDSIISYGTRWAPTTICPRAKKFVRQM